MRTKSPPLLAVALALGAFACQPPPEEAPGMSMEEMRTLNDQLRDDWVAATAADDAASVSAMYTADAVYVLPNGTVLSGRVAIEEYFAGMLPNSGGFTLSTLEFDATQDVAWQIGEWSQNVTGPEGESMTRGGKYLAVSVLQEDGSWKLRMTLIMQPVEM